MVVISTDYNKTEAEQSIEVFEKVLSDLKAQVQILKTKADETTGKIMPVKECSYLDHSSVEWYKPDRYWRPPTAEEVAGIARDAANKAMSEAEEIHKENIPAIENNKALIEKIKLIMQNIGIPSTYTHSYYKSNRSREKTRETHSAGYLDDIRRSIPISDGYETVKRDHDSFLKAIDKYEADQKQIEVARQREREKKEKEEKAVKQLAALVLKYGLPYESSWSDLLNKMLSMNKYLHLAHWLNRNREDWSDGYSYAKVGINNFKVENEQDREILDSLLALIGENWDGDGRVFRDTKWNYDALYSLVPEDLRSDFMICRGNTNDE